MRFINFHFTVAMQLLRVANDVYWSGILWYASCVQCVSKFSPKDHITQFLITTVSIYQIITIQCRYSVHLWMVNWEGFGRKRPWSNRDMIVALALSDWGQQLNTSTKIAAFLSGIQSAFNCKPLPLHMSVR